MVVLGYKKGGLFETVLKPIFINGRDNGGYIP